MRGGSGSEEVACEVPQEVMNHPMFSNGTRAGAGGDCPSQQEIHDMKNMKFISIKGSDVQDPDWYMNNQVNGPSLGKSVSEEVSSYEKSTWKTTTHANPNRTQKRKHQINWLAHEAMEQEAELLDRKPAPVLPSPRLQCDGHWDLL